ncbi:CCA tRNA nucleotidyltransferase [Oscillatoria acuminata]|uniref:tRNA nucleotidyltransferase/poly(A) polymerase n=1 Tax=Oscillatoria acuminata PCC 6304 TaxID=56110 RepID=K9TJI9_9CYAN|nr:CCA tRNA nucleotidyltransferase [Oscillatoria acuminata]AFY82189.1 tRNA nucleotidyltransferase/poly(A) polymerase [Oscillatoria acuminata PCC 6304]
MKQGESIRALGPETWPFSVEMLPADAYLVGGSVRDALLERQSPYLDLDFVLPGYAIKIAKQIADRYKAGFVVLDDERKIARVVFPHATVDFAKQEGMTLEADLQRRDFTINAIAYHPKTGQIVDPLNGREDLQNRTIRMISPTNLADDPLRLLRGYRQAAQLGFTLEPQTQAAIRQLAPLLRQVAAERVNTELWYLLNRRGGSAHLVAAWEDGLLRYWLPDATKDSLAILTRIDEAAMQLGGKWPQLGEEFLLDLRATLRISGYLGIAKLVCLLPLEPGKAEAQLMRLKLSRVEIKATIQVIKSWQLIHQQPELTDWTVRSHYFLFRQVGSLFPSLAAMAIASGISLETLSNAVERYLNPEDLAAHPKVLITGTDLMDELGIPRGPQIGEILNQIQLATVEGEISTREEAIALADEIRRSIR